MNEHLKALLEKRNALAVEVNAKGDGLLAKRTEIDKNYQKDTPEYAEAYGVLEAEILEQKAKRDEILELDTLIDAADQIGEKQIKAIGADPTEPVTDQSMVAAAIGTLSSGKKTPFWSRYTTDFHGFLQKNRLTTKDDIQNRPVLQSAILKDGQTFNSVASFWATFGENKAEVYQASKSIGLELNIGAELETALKSTRESYQKSMFTQHPLAGGDGSLYDPTAVFPGNTGGLCEYFIDDVIEVLPYPPATFLECIPVRRIPKPYLLYVRQTLRVNNASTVGESVILTGINNPTGAAVDFTPEKPESEFGFSQAKAYTITFADTIPVSEEFLEDCPQIADIVENQLMENVRQELYDQIINGDGSDGENPEILGLLAQVGVSTRIHRGAASFMGNAMGAGAADDDIHDTLERAVFDAQAYGYNVDCILVSHTDYVKMAMAKDEEGHKLYGDCACGSVDTIRGAKVRADTRMAAGTAIAGAFRQVVQLLIRRAIRLDIGWVNNQFKIDMLTLRATLRAGLLVRVPHALIRVTALA